MRPAILIAPHAVSQAFWKSPRQGRRRPSLSNRGVQVFPWKMNGQSGRRRSCWRAITAMSSGVLLMEQLEYNLLFRWFVGLSMDDPVWDATTFTKNRDRLLDGDIADAFFREVLAEAEAAGLVSDEHFTVDGTLLEAWASQKRFRR